MKAKELARVLRSLVRLVEKDLHELADSVAEIDHRTSDTRRHLEARIEGRYERLVERIVHLENAHAELEGATLAVTNAHAHRLAALEESANGSHSRKV